MTQEQTDKNESASAGKPTLPIVIDGYISDGPGFCGKIEFKIEGNRLTQNCYSNNVKRPSNDVETCSFDLPVNIGEVVAVHDAPDDQAEHILNLMDEAAREHLENDPSHIALERVKLIEFADGQNGALIVYGEPCFFTLTVGSKAFEFNDGEPGFYERDIDPIAEESPEVHRPG